MTKVFLIFSLLLALFITSALKGETEHKNSLNVSKIEELTGLKGNLDKKESVFKVTFPRDDLKAKVGKVKLTPALGLTAWTAFY